MLLKHFSEQRPRRAMEQQLSATCRSSLAAPALPCSSLPGGNGSTAAPWYCFGGEHRYKVYKQNQKRWSLAWLPPNRCNLQSPQKSRTKSRGPLLRSVLKAGPSHLLVVKLHDVAINYSCYLVLALTDVPLSLYSNYQLAASRLHTLIVALI